MKLYKENIKNKFFIIYFTFYLFNFIIITYIILAQDLIAPKVCNNYKTINPNLNRL